MEKIIPHIEMMPVEFPAYSIIVIASILTGVIFASLIMYRAGVRRNTIIYTALLTFVCIMVCGLSFSIITSAGHKTIGFTGAGGAIGLLTGSFISLLIHCDHETETICSWIITAPLMYGLSKTACHVVGCCHGICYSHTGYIIYTTEGIPRFPVQLTETVIFLLIFMVGLVLFIGVKKPFVAAIVVEILCIIAKFGTDYLRESHYESGHILSSNQISAIVCGVMAVTLTLISNRLIKKKKLVSDHK